MTCRYVCRKFASSRYAWFCFACTFAVIDTLACIIRNFSFWHARKFLDVYISATDLQYTEDIARWCFFVFFKVSVVLRHLFVYKLKLVQDMSFVIYLTDLRDFLLQVWTIWKFWVLYFNVISEFIDMQRTRRGIWAKCCKYVASELLSCKTKNMIIKLIFSEAIILASFKNQGVNSVVFSCS